MSNTLKRNVIRQRPRLLYAGAHTQGVGWLTEKHVSDDVELLLVCEGSGKTEIAEETYPFAAGDLIVCNGGCAHREYFDDTAKKELLFLGLGNLHLFGQAPGTILKDRDFCLVHTQDYFAPLRCYFSQIIAETESVQPLHESIAEHLLQIILLFTMRLVAYDENLTFNENVGYLAAKRYFDEHFLDIDTIDAVCKSLFINKYYLSHLFAQNVGMPPVRYLINKRIDLACHYLETTDMNVADIGKACGYADPCYFSRMFKKVKRVTPLRYRYLFKLDKANKAEKPNKNDES